MKTIFMTMLLLFCTVLEAKMVDGIALIVEGEPITTAEIKAVQNQYGNSKEKAINMLIQDRLQKVAMQDILVHESEIDKKISEIAVRNGVTLPQMQQILEQQGTSWNHYRTTIKDAIKKEKFFKQKVVSSIRTPSEDELKLYYKNHLSQFIIPDTVKMKSYSTASKKTMKRFLSTGDTQGMKVKTLTKKIDDINPGLLPSILQTPVGQLTSPLDAGNRYIVYKMLSKSGKTTLPFGDARQAVLKLWQQDQQTKALKDYFEKLRTRAEIQKIR